MVCVGTGGGSKDGPDALLWQCEGGRLVGPLGGSTKRGDRVLRKWAITTVTTHLPWLEVCQVGYGL